MKKLLFMVILNMTSLFCSDRTASPYRIYSDNTNSQEEINDCLVKLSQKGIPAVITGLIGSYFKLRVPLEIYLENSAELVKASFEGDIKRVRELLESEAVDVNFVGHINRTALVQAADKNRTEIIKLLLKMPNIDANYISTAGTALMRAVESGNKESVEILLADPRVNIDINSPAHGGTALMIAAVHTEHDIYREIMELLLQNGAGLSGEDSKKRNLLTIVLENGDDLTIDLLRRYGVTINLSESDSKEEKSA